MTGKGMVQGSDGERERASDSTEAKLDVIHTAKGSGETTLTINSQSCPCMWEEVPTTPPSQDLSTQTKIEKTKWDEREKKRTKEIVKEWEDMTRS